MPKLKKGEDKLEETEEIQTLTATRSRRTIKPNRKYLDDSVVIPTKHSSPENSGDDTEDEYRGNDDDEDDEDLKELERLEKLPTPIRGKGKMMQKQTPMSELRKKMMKTDLVINVMDIKKTESAKLMLSKRAQEDKKGTAVRILRNNPTIGETPERKTVGTPVRKPPTTTTPARKPILSRQQQKDDESSEEDEEVSKKAAPLKKYSPRSVAKKPKKDQASDDENETDDEPEIRTTRSGGPATRKSPGATSTPKPRTTLRGKSEKKENPLEQDDDDEEEEGEKEESVKIVNIKEIMRNKVPVSTTPLQRSTTALATTILDRKRYQKEGASPPSKMQKLEDGKKATQLIRLPSKPNSQNIKILQKVPAKKSVETTFDLSRDDKIDFEEVLEKSIVRPGDKEKIVTPRTIKSARRRVSEHSEPDESEVRSKKPAVPSTTTVNNNVIVISSNNNGNLIKKPAPPTKTPPRILNASLNRSNRSLNASGTTDSDSSFSIDLTDNDNNVKLIAAKPKLAPPQQKKAIMLASPSPLSVGLRNNSNIINKKTAVLQMPVAKSSAKTKKITCFETWYVINIPEDEPFLNERGVLEMSMIALGNRAAEIRLPSSAWSYKITLVKLKTPKRPGEETYTGDVQDTNIDDSEKHKYEPFNIMFRRQAANSLPNRLSYDRAVVFKSHMFFINIQGRCARLIGAPQSIEQADDVQTLLSIVDSVTLKSPFVELTTSP